MHSYYTKGNLFSSSARIRPTGINSRYLAVSEVGETIEAAAVREAKEETGLDITLIKLLGVYSDPSRDPRGHTVSVCFLATGSGNLKAGSDAKDIRLFSLNQIPILAFDHNKIIENAKSDINGILSKM
jgi:8-oxo-dGTP diphosphatase